MKTTMTIKRFCLLSVILFLSGFFGSYAQETGYWKLERIETDNKMQVSGQLSREVTGKAGDLVYTLDNGAHSKLVVKGSWTPLPEILHPNDEVSFKAELKIEEFQPPKGHFSPIVTMSFVSWYSTGSIEDMKGNTAYCHSTLTVKATTSADPKKNIPTASELVALKGPESPAKLKGEYLIIKVRMGMSLAYRDYFYVYKWQQGEAPAVIIDNDQAFVWKLERIETDNKMQVSGQLSREVTGEAGDLVYTLDNGAHSKLVVKGSWTPLPEILHPNDEVSFNAELKIEEFQPPKGHFSPIVTMSFVSWYSSGSIEDMKGNTAYCHSTLTVKATTSADPKKNIPTASELVALKGPESPAKLKGEYLIIKVRMGMSLAYRDYFYVYKWQQGR